MLSTRPYQDEALAAVDAAAARGLRRIVVAMATGLGKTVAFSHLVRRRGGRAIVLAHRDELIRQAAAKIRMVNPQASVGVVKADEDEVGADVVVASVQTLARPARLERLISPGPSLFSGSDVPLRTVVVDEMHHYLGGDEGNTFGRVLEGLGAFAADGPLVVGWTATPERGDGGALGATWQEVVYEMGILAGIRHGYLAPLRAKQVQLRADFSQLHVKRGKIDDDEAAAMLLAADAPRHAAEAYLRHAAGRKALVFTPTVAVAQAMAEAFRAVGVAAEWASGDMAMDERRAVLRRLSTGETMVVPNAQLLTEGFDEPSIACVIMARPTRSRPFAIQCIGRGTRTHPGKTDCLVLDLVGAATRMDLVTVASLFDISPEAAEAGVLQAVEALAGAAAGDDEPRPDGQLVATDVSLLGERPFAWVEARRGEFSLDLGPAPDDPQSRRRLFLVPAGNDTWDLFGVRHVQQGPWRRWTKVREAKLLSGLSLGYAMGAAEDVARREGARALLDRGAAWRREQPSAGQQSYLERRGRWRPGMSRGEASDVISALSARR